MIADFVASWALFHNSYLAGGLIALLLALVGVVVVARNQIFIGAAVSQASTLGIALAMALGSWVGHDRLPWLESDGFQSASAVVFCILAAGLTARGGAAGRETHEALTGWVFLFSASAAILLVANSPHGLEEIHRLVASSIIGATRGDVWVFALLAAVTALALVRLHRAVLLFALDPAMSAAVGMRAAVWSTVVAVWLGLVLGLSIRVAGLLYAFGCLVLPPLVARNVCREVRPMFLVAPAVAVAGAGAAFVVAHHWDYPPGQMAVALLCLLVALARPRSWRGA